MAKNHRTALLIDASKGFTNPFAERVNRLLQSVNGSNIKVDVYHLGAASSVALNDGPPAAAASTSVASATTLEQAEATLRSQGYDQILVSKPGK